MSVVSYRGAAGWLIGRHLGHVALTIQEVSLGLLLSDGHNVLSERRRNTKGVLKVSLRTGRL